MRRDIEITGRGNLAPASEAVCSMLALTFLGQYQVVHFFQILVSLWAKWKIFSNSYLYVRNVIHYIYLNIDSAIPCIKVEKVKGIGRE